mgnify:CR=1 FL=1
MNILEFYESNYKRDSEFKKNNSDSGYEEWQNKQKAIFQNITKERSYFLAQWEYKIKPGLIKAIKDGRIQLVRECFWVSQIGAEIDSASLPAIVSWGMKRAASIAHCQGIYDMLNVKLTVRDIRGESFYAGFPTPKENDVELGKLLNQIDMYGE